MVYIPEQDMKIIDEYKSSLFQNTGVNIKDLIKKGEKKKMKINVNTPENDLRDRVKAGKIEFPFMTLYHGRCIILYNKVEDEMNNCKYFMVNINDGFVNEFKTLDKLANSMGNEERLITEITVDTE